LEAMMSAIPATDECRSQVLDRRAMEYVYQDGDGLLFLDVESDALVTLPHERAGAWRLFLREGNRVDLVFHEGEPLHLEPPAAVELTVIDTAPSTSSASDSKLAVLETGLKIMVPGCIDIGQQVVVDTRRGAYLGKAD
jgi:elongation factor P